MPSGSDLSRRDFLSWVSASALIGGAVSPAPVRGPKGLAAQAEQAAPKPDRKVRIGVVGGNFGCSFQWHLDPNCTVEAVSDLRPERRARLQKTYKCQKAYESLEKLVLDEKVEAVAVFTGAPDHARHVLEAFGHGKHCISAVPACQTLEEARKLKEAKERTGLTYMMAETSYYRWPTILARNLWSEKRFGRFVYSEQLKVPSFDPPR